MSIRHLKLLKVALYAKQAVMESMNGLVASFEAVVRWIEYVIAQDEAH
jgi:hypothetical protein